MEIYPLARKLKLEIGNFGNPKSNEKITAT